MGTMFEELIRRFSEQSNETCRGSSSPDRARASGESRKQGQHAAMGGRRGSSASMATDQPVARALHRREAPPRQVESGQDGGRSQGADSRLAHPRARRALPTTNAPQPQPCPGKLLHSSGRLRPTNDLRSRDSCNPTTCATSAERDLSTQRRHDRRRAESDTARS
jgi:hypothetical protein